MYSVLLVSFFTLFLTFNKMANNQQQKKYKRISLFSLQFIKSELTPMVSLLLLRKLKKIYSCYMIKSSFCVILDVKKKTIIKKTDAWDCDWCWDEIHKDWLWKQKIFWCDLLFQYVKVLIFSEIVLCFTFRFLVKVMSIFGEYKKQFHSFSKE